MDDVMRGRWECYNRTHPARYFRYLTHHDIKPEAPVVAGGELGMKHVMLRVDVVSR